MLRTLLFFLLLGLAALGIAWIADRPGDIAVNWQGYHVETSLGVALAALAALVIVLMLLWALLRLLFRLPAIIRSRTQARRQRKGYGALSAGLVAVGAGSVATALSQARDARRLLGDGPLTLLLQAQAQQLGGDRAAAEATFTQMLAHPAARALGHRGLHVEALRRGDADAAHQHALEAQRDSSLPWAAQAVFDRHTSMQDWAGALTLVEQSAKARLTDKASANRQRAVLKTAMALDAEARDPATALTLAREAIKLAPGLVPAVTLAARLLLPGRDARKAERLVEDAWRLQPHPDLATAYISARVGAGTADRLAQARGLARLAPQHAESAMAVAHAAIAARSTDLARSTLAPLLATGRPGVRLCLLMADLEDAAGSATGLVREWLARASRAPRDATWMADGIASDRWLPVSPASGRLDAFVWQVPPEDLHAVEHIELAALPPPAALPMPSAPIIGSDHTAAPALPAPAVVAAAKVVPVPAEEPAVAVSPQVNAPDDPGPDNPDDGQTAKNRWFS